MHRLIIDDDEWQTLQKDRKRITTAAELHRRQSDAEQATYRRQLAEHVVAKEAALLAGEPAPAPPNRPTLDPADVHIFMNQLEQCALRERQWLGLAADRLGQRLENRETELIGRASTAVQELRHISEEMSELCNSARQVRAASEDRSPVHRRAVRAADLVAAIEGGRRFLSRLLPEGDVHLGGQRSHDDSPASFDQEPFDPEPPERRARTQWRHPLEGRR